MADRDPLAILNRARAAALGYAHKTSATNVAAMLKRAQADLNRRLKDVKPTDKTFTATQLRTTLRQVDQVLKDLKPSLATGVVKGSEVVAQGAAEATVRYIGAAEKRYAGVSGEALGINTAQVFDTAVSGARASVLRRLMTDPEHPARPGIIDRYGEAVVGHFERTLQTAMVAGTPWDDVRNQLIEGSPFLQQAPAHWAERIVRTEFMGAHNTAGYLGMQEINDQTGGGMIRILCATFDDRTGSDSIAYHGQIRRMDEPFDAWKGEKYLTPPNRPNDREIVVPHHMEWELPENLRPKPDSDVLARWRLEGRKGAPPARPKLSTVPVEQIGKPVADRQQQGTGQQPQPPPQPQQEVRRPINPRVRRPAEEIATMGVQEVFRSHTKALGSKHNVQVMEGWNNLMGDLGYGPSRMEHFYTGPTIDGILKQAHADGMCKWTGEVLVKTDRLKDYHEVMSAVAAGKEVRTGTATGLRVVAHEVLHAHSPATQSAYAGVGKVLEEVCVEAQARALTAKIVGYNPGGVYGKWLNGVQALVQQHTGDLTIKVADVADKIWKKKGNRIASAHDFVKQFVDAAGIPRAKLSAFKDGLRRLGNP